MHDIFHQIDQIDTIFIENRTYHIRKCFGGDLKFLSIVYGIKGANSDYPCIWCICHKDDFGDMSKRWSITDANFGARKLETAHAFTEHNSSKQFGFQNKPLTSIEFDDCVIDLLHLLLRISDTLFKLFMNDLFVADKSDSSDLTKRPNLSIFLNYLKLTCKISNPYYTCHTTRRIELRSFNGNEILIIFSNSNLSFLFPNIENINNVSDLWMEFYSIYVYIKNPVLNISVLEEHLFEWLALFKCTYFSKYITPYIHSFVFHLPEFIKIHGNINLFNLQGLEKLNDLTTIAFQRSSNKRKTYLKQLIDKRNRYEFFLFD